MMSEQISSIRDNLITKLLYSQKECSEKIWINVHSHVSDQIVNSLETSDHNNKDQGFYCLSLQFLQMQNCHHCRLRQIKHQRCQINPSTIVKGTIQSNLKVVLGLRKLARNEMIIIQILYGKACDKVVDHFSRVHVAMDLKQDILLLGLGGTIAETCVLLTEQFIGLS